MQNEILETAELRAAPMPWDTLPAMLITNFELYAEKTTVVDENVRLSYAEMGRRVLYTAENVARAGIGKGDLVVVWAPNSWRWIVNAGNDPDCCSPVQPVKDSRAHGK